MATGCNAETEDFHYAAKVALANVPAAMLTPIDPYDRVLAAAPAPEPVAAPVAQLATSRPPAPAEVREVPQPRRVAV